MQTKISLFFKVLVIALVSTYLAGCSSSVDRQAANSDHDGAKDNGRQMDEIIVTARRAEESTQNVPISVTVFNPAPMTAISAIAAPYVPPINSERYQRFDESAIKNTASQNISTFSLDVDTGSYANIRRFIESGQLPPSDSVRVEEMVNYFKYSYPAVNSNAADPFVVSTQMGVSPWNREHLLMRIGVKAIEKNIAEMPPANLVFLVDVSGSMNSPDKLPLVQSSLRMLVDQLREQDRITLIVYAGRTALELPSTSGAEKEKIHAAIDRLQAGGSTAGESALRMAYAEAKANFIEHGINRILLATDGDFNVGTTDTNQLLDLVKAKRKEGVTLTTLGFGTGNYNEDMMEQIADAGNGNYAYIDSAFEAKRVLVDELSSTFNTVASDVKIQVEFNPEQVAEWRLIGYENRALKEEDFKNDKVDAGDVGAGKCVTALYEITPKGKPTMSADRRYAQTKIDDTDSLKNEVAEVRVRYKKNQNEKSIELKQVIQGDALAVANSAVKGDNDLRFSAAVAAFGQRLRDSKYLNDFDYKQIARLARDAKGSDKDGDRQAFIKLVETAAALDTHRTGGEIGALQ